MDWTERKAFVEGALKDLVLATDLKYWVADLTLYKRMGRESIKVTYLNGKARRIHGVQGVPLCQIAAMVFAESRWMYFNRCDYSGGGSRLPNDDEYSYYNIAGTRLKDKVKFRSTYSFDDERIIVELKALVCQGCDELLESYMAKNFTEVAVEYIQGKLEFINDDGRTYINVYNDVGELIYQCSEHQLEGHLISVEVVAIERDNPFAGALRSV